jgi:hypothetical protein
VHRLDKSLLERLRIQTIEGIPALMTASLNSVDAAAKIGVQVLYILSKSLGAAWKQSELSENFPLGSYVYKIHRELDKRREPVQPTAEPKL